MSEQVDSRATSLAGAALWRALRPHQWVKNALVLVPVVMAHRAPSEPERLAAALLAAACFCAVASAGYLLNDWLDREADRTHPSKRLRPLASGALSPRVAAAAFALLLVAGFGAALARLPAGFSALLALYLVLTTAYSLDLKRRVIVDVLSLAALYTLRILAGGTAAAVPISPWLLVFSMFFFLSLAFVKRYAELVAAARARDREVLAGRGYHVEDLALIPAMGLASGFASILVIGLWASSPDVLALYRAPTFLWLACPVLFHWLMRIWLRAHRGRLDADPVLFAATDPPSYAAGALLVAIGVLATRGLGA
jgi:4-hydroxybenzoate polyprenyltransferase